MKKKFISTKVIITAIVSLIVCIGCFLTAIIIIFNSNCTLAKELKNHNFSILDDFEFNGRFTSKFNDTRSITIDDNIEKININSTAADIEVEFTNSIATEIKMTIEGTFSDTKSFEDIIGDFGYSNNIATISTKENSLSFGTFKLKLFIPSQYKNNININTVSGDIDCSNAITLSSFNIEATSGDIEINNLNTQNTSISTISGDIDIENFKTKQSNINTTSGDIYAETSELGISKIKTTSGDIDIEMTRLDKSMDINSTSGDVYLTVPSKENFDVNFSSLSGDLYDDSSHKSGEKIINVITKSGDLDISDN
ncbi:DUF4097 domain-containing protein [Clostridium sp. MSJ-8]|uniref:DUF4097 family beta strand repeat-containing protein n=1 Tax=Clostridium sp. MSJ-8 TaxID=2841510 RepID=UPI001C0F199F|nr:DUF4097 family beta strand repeat-containing protein [Clostridium sp. MSJ-8]MBU5488258.1 DUF4097 domain-containing protein [Clostridium sp. MSJ-8]